MICGQRKQPKRTPRNRETTIPDRRMKVFRIPDRRMKVFRNLRVNDDFDDNFHRVASADDPQGLKMARAAARAGGLRTDDEFKKFHKAVSGKGITDFEELVEIARQINEDGDY